MSPRTSTTTRPTLLHRPLLGLLILLVGACAAAPSGPPFELASPPPAHRGRLYLYRVDARPSLSKVHVTLDGREVGTFRDGEYETLEVSAGPRHLRVGLRGFGLLQWGWNDQRLHVEPGETLFVELSVRLAARELPAAGELEIGGRDEGSASENVFIELQNAETALPRLAGTTRLTPAETATETAH
ncbi:MAG: hypothetical protein H6748_08675 [Spirochaetaceae bacterium]|nr:hypothetical protein [Myxococcales bacterium]MCB9724103.1 hypothetical protein [Spirochaetaceae bacterium]